MEENQKTKNNLIRSLIGKFKLFFKPLGEKLFGWWQKIFQDDFFKNLIVLWLAILSLGSNIINWAILILFIRLSSGNIILHYNVYFGVDKIGGWKNAFLLPLIGLAVFLINLLLAAYLYRKKERIASYILLVASFMVQLILAVASISVIIINY
jgi:hypothetical protein